MGIEPTSGAWEVSILPLYDARSSCSMRYTQTWVCANRGSGRDRIRELSVSYCYNVPRAPFLSNTYARQFGYFRDYS
jgi:hypothetical protein